ncbi:MAG: flavodoxin [Selenomonadaceae bacterium]|nr:flavodoxin [Selenomonadaceae bacterium]
MKKIAIVYWSGTGNTEAMAKAIYEGAKEVGAVALFEVDAFAGEKAADYAGFIFGCPAMGDEVLEEGSFEPFFADIEDKLTGVPVALFGSYGWGGGAWMQTWQERVKNAGGKLFAEGLIAENSPSAEVLEACRALGRDFVKGL